LGPGNKFWNRVQVPGSCYKSLISAQLSLINTAIMANQPQRREAEKFENKPRTGLPCTAYQWSSKSHDTKQLPVSLIKHQARPIMSPTFRVATL